MKIAKLYFSRHAIRQMFDRRISTEQVRSVIETGEVVIDYPDDRPYPSFLMLATVAGRPLHVVVAYDETSDVGHVITTYEPDPAKWSEDFRERRPS